jgi:hypothetical protein
MFGNTNKLIAIVLFLILNFSLIFPVFHAPVEMPDQQESQQPNRQDPTSTGTRHLSDTQGGYGLVAIFSENKPTIDGIKKQGEWDDAKYDIVEFGGIPILNISLKHNGQEAFVLVEVLNDNKGNNTDYCEIAFDSDHDGTLLEAEDKKFKVTNGGSKSNYEGMSGIWISGSAGFYAGTSANPVLYEFRIDKNYDVWNSPISDGSLAGFCVHVYSSNVQDTGFEGYAYWPDDMAIKSGETAIPNPINDTKVWGDLLFNRPRIVLNEISSFGSGNNEWVELYNNGTDIDMNGINITDQDGNNYQFTSMVFPQKSYLVLKSGSGVDDLDFSDNIGTKHLGTSPTWNGNTLNKSYDEVLLKYGGNDCGIDYINYTNQVVYPDPCPTDTKSVNKWSVKQGGWLKPPGNIDVTLSRAPNGFDSQDSQDWILASFPTEGEENSFGSGSPGFGLVTVNSMVIPTIDGIKNTGEWDDALVDVVNIMDVEYYSVYTKRDGNYLYVCIEIDPDYNSSVGNGDYANVIFDRAHDEGDSPQKDDWLVECKYSGTSTVNKTQEGNGNNWQAQSWPAYWEADVDDDSDSLQVYEFKINVSTVFTSVSGSLVGFGVKVYDDYKGDEIYWPDRLNPVSNPENVPDLWGHLINDRPMLLINKVKPNGTDHFEQLSLYNNCSASIKIDNVIISDQDGNYFVLPNATIPPYKNLTIISGKGQNEFDFTDDNGTVYIEGTNWWNEKGDDIVIRYHMNGCTFDYMQFGAGNEVDGHPVDSTSNSFWTQNSPILPAPKFNEHLTREYDGSDTNQSSDWYLVSPIQNPIHHISLTPVYDYPSHEPVRAGGILGYRALGWNDEGETEKNLSWWPVWDTTDHLGVPVNFKGNPQIGYSIDYSAGYVYGFDNITVSDSLTVTDNRSCIKILPNPLDHISLTPRHTYPNYDKVYASKIYTAMGWNDVDENEKNLSWDPVWGTTHSMGMPTSFGGNASFGYTAKYQAWSYPAIDNITVMNTLTGIINISCIEIIGNPLHHITLTPMYNHPSGKSINAGNKITGYTAIGWNDISQTEINLTWEPTWGTTNGLGTPKYFGGDASSGFTAEYKAGYTPGFDNITIKNTATGITNKSCIMIIGNGLHHISLTPSYSHPSYKSVKAGLSLTGYRAIGWNDETELERNVTWSATWTTSDSLGTTNNYGGEVYEGYTADYYAGVVPGYDNITVFDSPTDIKSKSCIRINANSLDHISLTPVYTFPSSRTINAGSSIIGYRAIGWNDDMELEKNLTWSADWSTTNSLGNLANLGGNAISGYTTDFNAGLVPGYDNITVSDTPSGILTKTCINIYGNPMHHISLSPIYDYPDFNTVYAGETITGFTAEAYNDAGKLERNLTWIPTWGTTDGLGTLNNKGGCADPGYSADYTAGLAPGFDNITVSDAPSSLSVRSSVRIIGNPLNHISLKPMYVYPSLYQIKAGDAIYGFTAVGWNDLAENEKNMSWMPFWGTTNSLGIPDNLGGSATSGFTVDYDAGFIPGTDNLTVIDADTGISNHTCIIVNSNSLDHITLTPSYAYPSNNLIKAGDKYAGYTAVGWNDIDENELNYTWVPNWGTTDGLGVIGNAGGSASLGYTIDYTAGFVPGYDNITVTDNLLFLTERSCIEIMIESPYQLVIISGNYQKATAGTKLTEPFVVEVQDQYETPIGEGVEIKWKISTIGLNNDGYLSNSEIVLTDKSSRASTSLYLDTRAGMNTVTAEIKSGGTSKVMFTATGTLPQISPYLEANVISVAQTQTFNYLIHYNNIGTEEAANVWINITLPSAISCVGDTSGIFPVVSGSSYSWKYPSVSMGFHSFILTCRVESNIVEGTQISSYFSVDYSDNSGNIRPAEKSNRVYLTVLSEPVKNVPPKIENVPDLVVRYDYDYKLDLTPYITDPDNTPDELYLIFSDSFHIRIDQLNNLKMIINYTFTYQGSTQPLNVTVSDGLGSDWDKISIRITDKFPPELVKDIPDVIMDEDTVRFPFNITHFFFDREGDAIYYAIGEENSNITFLDNHTVSIIPFKDWFGIEMVTFRATDSTGALIEDTIYITVLPVNDPPLISPIVDQTGKINSAWTLDISPYLQDIDNGLTELIVSTDSPQVTVNGLNLTFRYSKPVDLDIITITVSDGEAQVYGQFKVSVGKSEAASFESQLTNWMFILLLVIIILLVLAYIFIFKRNKFVVEDVFLIHKNGALLAHATTRIVPDMDTDMFSGMLTAIQSFVKDSFVDEKDFNLKKLEFGDQKIAVEVGKSGMVTLALVYKGTGNDLALSKMSSKAMEEIEDQYGETLKDWDGNMSDVRGTKDIISDIFKH